jgi:hypothetical protein
MAGSQVSTEGCVLGAQKTWSPSTGLSAWEVGFMSPQLGVSWHYSELEALLPGMPSDLPPLMDF